MEPTTQVTIVIGLIGLWGVGLQMTGSKFAGIFLMTVSALSIWWLFNPTSSSLLWGGWVSIALLHAIYGVWIGGASKKEVATEKNPRNLDKPEPGILPLLPPGLFEIEPPKWELYWRAVGTSSLVPFTPDPDNQPPESATVVLATETTITAIPTQHLEHIQLAIISQLLPPSPSSWLSTAISGERPCFFYFDIPPSLSHGPHFVHLVATTSLHGIIHQRPSPPFEIVLARTYQQLHRFRPQQFPLPS